MNRHMTILCVRKVGVYERFCTNNCVALHLRLWKKIVSFCIGGSTSDTTFLTLEGFACYP